MTIGQKIKSARIAHDLTQEELGLKIGVQKSAIAKWETGRVENIKRTSLIALAHALELSPSELIGDPSNPIEEKEPDPVMEEIKNILSDMTPDQLAQASSLLKWIKSGK